MNVRTVRAFAMEDLEYEQYDESLKKTSNLNKYLGFHIGIFQGLTNISFGAMFLSILYFGGSLVSSGELSSGSLMSYLISTQTLQKALGNLKIRFNSFYFSKFF